MFYPVSFFPVVTSTELYHSVGRAIRDSLSSDCTLPSPPSLLFFLWQLLAGSISCKTQRSVKRRKLKTDLQFSKLLNNALR